MIRIPKIKFYSSRGFSLIEVVMTTVIMGILFPGILYFFSSILEQYRSISYENRVASKASYAIKKLRGNLQGGTEVTTATEKNLVFTSGCEPVDYWISGSQLLVKTDGGYSILADGVDDNTSKFSYYKAIMVYPPEEMELPILLTEEIVCIKLKLVLTGDGDPRTYTTWIRYVEDGEKLSETE